MAGHESSRRLGHCPRAANALLLPDRHQPYPEVLREDDDGLLPNEPCFVPSAQVTGELLVEPLFGCIVGGRHVRLDAEQIAAARVLAQAADAGRTSVAGARCAQLLSALLLIHGRSPSPAHASRVLRTEAGILAPTCAGGETGSSAPRCASAHAADDFATTVSDGPGSQTSMLRSAR